MKVSIPAAELRSVLPELAMLVAGDGQTIPQSELPLQLEFGPPPALVLRTSHGAAARYPLERSGVHNLVAGLLAALKELPAASPEIPPFEMPTLAAVDRPRWAAARTETGGVVLAFPVSPSGPAILYQLTADDAEGFAEWLRANGYLPK